MAAERRLLGTVASARWERRRRLPHHRVVLVSFQRVVAVPASSGLDHGHRVEVHEADVGPDGRVLEQRRLGVSRPGPY